MMIRRKKLNKKQTNSIHRAVNDLIKGRKYASAFDLIKAFDIKDDQDPQRWKVTLHDGTVLICDDQKAKEMLAVTTHIELNK